ncbi:MAG: hypothetical protein ABI597_10870 [Gammaproteobacteria bacterium]
MRNFRFIFMFVALFATQQVFAQPGMMDRDKNCMTIAKACEAAGFTRGKSPNKGFWFDCMKPIVLGKTVAGVTIDPAVAKSCRQHKVNELKMELKEFQQSS